MYGLDGNCLREAHMFEHMVPQLVALFWEVVKPLDVGCKW